MQSFKNFLKLSRSSPRFLLSVVHAHTVFHRALGFPTATEAAYKLVFLFWLPCCALQCFGEEGAAKALRH